MHDDDDTLSNLKLACVNTHILNFIMHIFIFEKNSTQNLSRGQWSALTLTLSRRIKLRRIRKRVCSNLI